MKKIDIESWQSPVARQYGLRSIPHLVLYDAEGKRVTSDSGEALHRFERLD